MVRNSEEALHLLYELGASPRLLFHAQIVAEVSRLIIEYLERYALDFDRDFVEVGAVLHDAGKILHPDELEAAGSAHEQAGKELLLENGVQAGIARVCRSHASWFEMTCSFEELLIALADKLWRGKRDSELELAIIDMTAERIGKERWDIFIDMDATFERIAADGSVRLARSY